MRKFFYKFFSWSMIIVGIGGLLWFYWDFALYIALAGVGVKRLQNKLR